MGSSGDVNKYRTFHSSFHFHEIAFCFSHNRIVIDETLYIRLSFKIPEILLNSISRMIELSRRFVS